MERTSLAEPAIRIGSMADDQKYKSIQKELKTCEELLLQMDGGDEELFFDVQRLLILLESLPGVDAKNKKEVKEKIKKINEKMKKRKRGQ